MDKTTSNSKRLVKNTFFMYVRMGVLMCISLYTSRVVLKELGVDDFGIYNLVGSLVAMFTSVRTLFSASTQRFLNYEMGKKNYENLSIIFDTSIYINVFIALIFILGAESIGLWFLNNEINIDSSRLFAAQFVFQLSLFSAVIGILTTSYDAVVIAHEKMDYYAYLSIIEGTLKLGIVFILQIFTYDKLIVYGILMSFVSILILVVNYVYCRVSFEETRFTYKLNKKYLTEMTGFAGWNFLGVSAYTLTQNGLNMVLNVFGGAVVNAARGIAYQVHNVATQFMANIAIVINPFGVKLYSSGELDKFFQLFYISSKTLFFIQACVVLFLVLFTNEILSLWLYEVPQFTDVFLKLVLINTIIRSLHPALDLIFKSFGHMKYYQLTEGIVLFLPLVFSYFALKAGHSCSFVFVLVNAFELLNLFALVFWAKKLCSLSIKSYLFKIIFPCSLMFLVFLISYCFCVDLSLIAKLFVYFLSILLLVAVFFITLSNSEKLLLLSVFKH